MACHRNPMLGEMYALVRSEVLLAERLDRLAHQVSDASLAQMPDFTQRVAVLRQLEYISAKDVVELKVSLGPTSQLMISLPDSISNPQMLPCLHPVVVRLP